MKIRKSRENCPWIIIKSLEQLKPELSEKELSIYDKNLFSMIGKKK